MVCSRKVEAQRESFARRRAGRAIALKVQAPFGPIRLLRLWVSGREESKEDSRSGSRLRGFLPRRAGTLYFFALVPTAIIAERGLVGKKADRSRTQRG